MERLNVEETILRNYIHNDFVKVSNSKYRFIKDTMRRFNVNKNIQRLNKARKQIKAYCKDDILNILMNGGRYGR